MSTAPTVIKFGGTSVGTIERIQSIAQRVAALGTGSNRLVVVVSAMAGETDRLLALGRSIHAPDSAMASREMDALVSTGENVSAALLALALQARGVPARSFTAHQLTISTDGRFTRGRIRSVDARPLTLALDRGQICVVAGFQGTDGEGNLVTLGRGGSDTSAVALAVAVGAGCCEFYKDVDGVFTADPRLVPSARKIDRLTYAEMIELTSMGSKVLQMRSVELAMKHNLRLHVRSSFGSKPGTLIEPMMTNMEEPVVSALSHDLAQAKVTLHGLAPRPESLSEALAPLARDDISVDFITQQSDGKGGMSLSFTLEAGLLEAALASVRKALADGAHAGVQIEVDRDLAKVTAVGIGMRTHAGVAYRFFSCLTREGIPIQLALSTEIKVSCLIPAKDCQRALRVLHREYFESDEPTREAGPRSAD